MDFAQYSNSNISIYNEISAVDPGVLTKIVEYKVPKSRVFWLNQIDVNGDNIAEYMFTANSVTWDKKNSSFFQYSLTFDFINFDQGFSFSQNSLLEIWVTHNRPSQGSFNARIQGVLIGTRI